MKRVFVVLVFAAAVAACGLNPQPFPPDNPDAAGTGSDSGKGNDASTFGDAGGNMPDAAEDSAPVPEGDASSDADASDALVDAPTDAIEDVVLDVALDVATD